MDKTQPARVAPEHQAELNAMTDAAEARRNAATEGGLQWGQSSGCDLPTPAAFGHVEHAQGLQPFFTAQQMREYVAADRALRPAGDAAMPVAGWLTDDARIATDRTKTNSMPRASQASYSIALVKQADAEAALNAKDAEIAAQAARYSELFGAYHEACADIAVLKASAISDEAKAAVVRLNLHNLELRHTNMQAMCNSQHAEIAALKAEVEAERTRRWEGNRISSEEHAAEIAVLREALQAVLSLIDRDAPQLAGKIIGQARAAMAQAVQPTTKE